MGFYLDGVDGFSCRVSRVFLGGQYSHYMRHRHILSFKVSSSVSLKADVVLPQIFPRDRKKRNSFTDKDCEIYLSSV